MNHIHVGDILDVSADALICSANPNLNLSGGVGGAFLMKYGLEMQDYLHDYLKQQSMTVMEQGEFVEAPPFASPYKKVFHAVGVNGFYESSPGIIMTLLDNIFARCKDLGICSVAIPAIGTGYGNLEIEEFYEAYESSVAKESELSVCLCLKNNDMLEQLGINQN